METSITQRMQAIVEYCTKNDRKFDFSDPYSEMILPKYVADMKTCGDFLLVREFCKCFDNYESCHFKVDEILAGNEQGDTTELDWLVEQCELKIQEWQEWDKLFSENYTITNSLIDSFAKQVVERYGDKKRLTEYEGSSTLESCTNDIAAYLNDTKQSRELVKRFSDLWQGDIKRPEVSLARFYNSIKEDYKNGELKNSDFFTLLGKFGVPIDYIVMGRSLKKVEDTKEPEFSIGGLPAFFRSVVAHVAEVYAVPISYALISLIVAVSAAAGKVFFIYDGKRRNYAQIWAAIVANSGSGKSEVAQWFLEPLFGLDAQARQQADNNSTPRQIMLNDTTAEARQEALKNNQRGILQYTDELSTMISNLCRYTSSGEQSELLSIFGNSAIKVSRRGKPAMDIPEPVMSIFGGVQPLILQKVFKGDMLSDGFLARFCFVNEPNTIIEESDTPISEKLRSTYCQAIDNIYHAKECEFVVPDVVKQKIRAFASEMKKLAAKEDNPYRAAIYAKGNIWVQRLALICAAMRWVVEPSVCSVNTDDVGIAEEWARYFVLQGCRISEVVASRGLSYADVFTILKKINPDLSQNKCAKMLGISQQAVSKSLHKKVVSKL